MQNMKLALIVGQGEVNQPLLNDMAPNLPLVALDGAAHMLRETGLSADVIIGDFDSFDPAYYGTDLLFTNAHLSCCGNDAGRQNQVDQYISFILDAKTAGGAIDLPANTPFIYGGDLNLVGFSQQLTTLITGDIQDTGTWGAGGAPDRGAA